MDQVTKHMGFFQFLEIASVIQWGATHKELIYLRVQKIHSDIQWQGGEMDGNNSCRLPYIFLGLVFGAGPIINTHTNAVSIISLYPIPSERPSKVYLEKMMNFLSKELLTCFVGGVMRFYHRFHVILAFTLTAYGSSITYASIYVYILPTTYLYAFWNKD